MNEVFVLMKESGPLAAGTPKEKRAPWYAFPMYAQAARYLDQHVASAATAVQYTDMELQERDTSYGQHWHVLNKGRRFGLYIKEVELLDADAELESMEEHMETRMDKMMNKVEEVQTLMDGFKSQIKAIKTSLIEEKISLGEVDTKVSGGGSWRQNWN